MGLDLQIGKHNDAFTQNDAFTHITLHINNTNVKILKKIFPSKRPLWKYKRKSSLSLFDMQKCGKK